MPIAPWPPPDPARLVQRVQGSSLAVLFALAIPAIVSGQRSPFHEFQACPIPDLQTAADGALVLQQQTAELIARSQKGDPGGLCGAVHEEAS